MKLKRLSKRQKRKLLGLAIAGLIAGAGYVGQQWGIELPTEAANLSPGTYQVTQVHDGDTISVNMDGRVERVRMIGVDTPETQDPRKPVQCFGKSATTFTKGLLAGQAVRLETDPLNQNRDRYNRLLRYVYLPDGRLIQAEIIKQGYGFAYTSFPLTKAEEFKRYESEAREANRGLWAKCEPEANQYGGYTSNPAD